MLTLKELRKKIQITQTVAAKLLNISVRTYKRYEKKETKVHPLFYEKIKDFVEKKLTKEVSMLQTNRNAKINRSNYPKSVPHKVKQSGNENATLYAGDCFEVMKNFKDHSIDLILADLPYGTTACKWDSVLPLDLLWSEYKRLLKPGGAIVLTAAQPFTWKLCASNPEWFKYELIWEKPNGTNPLLVKVQPFRNHENILIFYDKQPTYNPQMIEGGKPYSGFYEPGRTIGEAYGKTNISRHRHNPEGTRYPKSVQKFKQERGGHPTQKPVALMEWLIKTYSNEDDVVLDNTMGSGTTGVACMMANRKFIGIELDHKYFKTAEKRILESLI